MSICKHLLIFMNLDDMLTVCVTCFLQRCVDAMRKLIWHSIAVRHLVKNRNEIRNWAEKCNTFDLKPFNTS
jgi:hypothetical protein